ncbi:MAG: ABC transporter permease [Acidobacteriota bacterium]
MLSALRHALALSWRSLRHEPRKAAALTTALWIAFSLPVLTWLSTQHLESSLFARSESTPILLGSPGNDYDLALSSLYFRSRPRETLPIATLTSIEAESPGLVVPIYLGHSLQGRPIVATSRSYFDVRGLTAESGRLPLQLGEIVVGAGVARELRLEVGDRLRNDLTNLYDLSGAYPFLLEVVGILASTRSADDDAVFTGLKTAWTLDGRMHGHDAVQPEDILGDENGTLEASAAIFLFAELNAQSRQSFHLHGDPDAAPISALLVFPSSRKQHDLLLGSIALRSDLQAIRPRKIVESVLEIVLRLQRLLGAGFLAIAVAMTLLVGTVLGLTARLRQRDLQLFRELGASRARVSAILGAEIVWVCCGALFASGATATATYFLLHHLLPL